jgi:hypothetical protein
LRNPTSLLAAMVVMALSASVSRASLTINLRFADGSTTHDITAADVGHDVEIDVWATITGQNAPSANNFYGLQYVYYSAVSSLPGGAGIGVSGAVDASANALSASFDFNGSQVGTTQDVNGDGVADVASNTDVTEDPKPRALPPGVYDDNSTVIKNPLPMGYEFEVEKLFFHVNSLATGETDFAPIIPATLLAGNGLVGANWWEDSSTDTGSSGIMNGPYFGGTSVRLVSPVPEPSSIGILLAVGGLLMGRRGGKRTESSIL